MGRCEGMLASGVGLALRPAWPFSVPTIPSLPRRTLLGFIVACASLPRPARAQDRAAITLIVPNPQGGSTDEVARVVATALRDIGGTPVTLAYVVGNAGIDGTNAIAAAAADGRTLGIAVSTAIVAGKLLTRSARYDPLRDFDWLAIFGTYPNAMLIPASSPARTMAEWLDFARRAPTPLHCGTFGRGSAGHLAMGFLRKEEGANIEHVQVQSMDASYARLDDGTLDVLFDGVPNVVARLASGRYRALAVTSALRVTALPDIPAFGEIWKGRSFEVWVGMIAPKGLPVPIYSELAAQLGVLCNEAQYVERFRPAGIRFVGLTGKAAREFIEADFIRTARLVAEYSIEGDR